MSATPAIELGELVLPGTDAGEAALVARAFHREIASLWQADRAAGLGWAGDIGDVTLAADPGGAADALGRAIALAVRERAVAGGERS